MAPPHAAPGDGSTAAANNPELTRANDRPSPSFPSSPILENTKLSLNPRDPVQHQLATPTTTPPPLQPSAEFITTTTTAASTASSPAPPDDAYAGPSPQPAGSSSSDSQPPPPQRPRSHTRSSSAATSSPSDPRRRNRLSISLPVVPPGIESISYRAPHTPSASASGASTPALGSAMAITPNLEDSVTFLTALAGQERRVLELREELQKAESELERLKEQWMMHEAHKKRREMLSLETSSYLTDGVREALASPTRREEYQRLQQNRANNESQPNPRRKVLPSQRHQRTLSLLSPERGTLRQPFPQPDDVGGSMAPPPAPLQKRHTVSMAPPAARSSGESSHTARAHSLDMVHDGYGHGQQRRPKGQDVLLQTGKQIADDFKEGLWTFIEDLKQATVGDDTQNVPRRVPSRNNVREGGKSDPRTPPNGKGKQKEESLENRRGSNSSSASFSDRDTQSFRWSTSTTLSEPGVMTPPTAASTPRTSTSSNTSPFKQPESIIPASTSSTPSHIWGALASSTAFITQGQFKKHANALMSQVEKSLSLPPIDDLSTATVTTASTSSNSDSATASAIKRPSSTFHTNGSTEGQLRSRSRAETTAKTDHTA